MDLKATPAAPTLRLESAAFQRLQRESAGYGKDIKTLRVKMDRPAGGGG